MRKLWYALLLAAAVGHAQVQLGGHPYVPSSTDSTLGGAVINWVADGDCDITASSRPNCTVTSVTPADATSGPFVGSFSLQSSVSLTATRKLTVYTGGLRGAWYANTTQGGQAISISGPSGAAGSLPNCTVSAASCSQYAWWDGSQIRMLGGGGTSSSSTSGLNPLDYGLVCDAVETVHQTNGLVQYSTVTGTDNTAALAAVFAAAKITPAAAQIAEADTGSAQHKAIVFPTGCKFAAATFPSINDPIEIEGNYSRAYITATSGNGPVYTSINSGNVSGIANAVERNMEVTYAGTPNASTGICAGFISGTQDTEENIGCYGFRLGHVRAGVEYSSFTNLRGSLNQVGMLCTAASYANYPSPAAISASGTTSINNMTRDLVIRGNTINFVGNGCNSEKVENATFGFGKAADIILGAIDFPYISAATVSGGVCTANSAIPVAFTDTADSVVPAQGIVITNGSGVPTSVDVYNGGRGYVLANTTVSVPTAGAVSCTTTPTITPTITALTGILPFSGAANAGQSQLWFEHLILENESKDATGVSNHPTMGFQVVLGPTTTTTHLDHVIQSLGDSVPYGDYGRYLRNEGIDNEASDTIFSANTDPGTGTVCPYLNLSGHTLEHNENARIGDPMGMVCDPSGHVDTSYDTAVDGWRTNSGGTVQMKRGRGVSVQGSYGYNADSEPALDADEPGDTQERFKVTPSGRMSFGTGSAAPDVTLGRVVGSALGGIWGPISGGYANAPVAISLGNGVVPNITQTFTSSNANSSIYPNPGSSGIPSGYQCSGNWVWNGVGSGSASWQYAATASCVDSQGTGESLYTSFNHPLGSEVWTLGTLTVGSCAGCGGGGAGNPGGSNLQVQFNNSGNFGGLGVTTDAATHTALLGIGRITNNYFPSTPDTSNPLTNGMSTAWTTSINYADQIATLGTIYSQEYADRNINFFGTGLPISTDSLHGETTGGYESLIFHSAVPSQTIVRGDQITCTANSDCQDIVIHMKTSGGDSITNAENHSPLRVYNGPATYYSGYVLSGVTAGSTTLSLSDVNKDALGQGRLISDTSTGVTGTVSSVTTSPAFPAPWYVVTLSADTGLGTSSIYDSASGAISVSQINAGAVTIPISTTPSFTGASASIASFSGTKICGLLNYGAGQIQDDMEWSLATFVDATHLQFAHLAHPHGPNFGIACDGMVSSEAEFANLTAVNGAPEGYPVFASVNGSSFIVANNHTQAAPTLATGPFSSSVTIFKAVEIQAIPVVNGAMTNPLTVSPIPAGMASGHNASIPFDRYPAWGGAYIEADGHYVGTPTSALQIVSNNPSPQFSAISIGMANTGYNGVYPGAAITITGNFNYALESSIGAVGGVRLDDMVAGTSKCLFVTNIGNPFCYDGSVISLGSSTEVDMPGLTVTANAISAPIANALFNNLNLNGKLTLQGQISTSFDMDVLNTGAATTNALNFSAGFAGTGIVGNSGQTYPDSVLFGLSAPGGPGGANTTVVGFHADVPPADGSSCGANAVNPTGVQIYYLKSATGTNAGIGVCDAGVYHSWFHD